MENKKPTTGSSRSYSCQFPDMASNDDPVMGSLSATDFFAMPPLAQWFRLLLFNYIDMFYLRTPLWWTDGDSNPTPPLCKSGALPNELSAPLILPSLAYKSSFFNSSNSSFWRLDSLAGVLSCIFTKTSPLPKPDFFGIPLPEILITAPDWMPVGIWR